MIDAIDRGIDRLPSAKRELKPERAKIVDDPSTQKFKNNEILLYRSLKSYFKANPDSIDLMLAIIDGTSKISLRILDYFVIRHAKKNKVKYDIEYPNGENETFIVHLNYRAQLKSFTKKYFDPFRRKVKFNFGYGDGKTLMTTIGQLNFFKWAISCKVIDYVDEHYDDIMKAMNSSNKDQKKKAKSEKSIKVSSKSKIKMIARRELRRDRLDITVSFE